jgi:cupin fold WbuC family metalloprotein
MTEHRALPAPSSELFVLGDEALQTTVRASRDSPRRRMIQPFHRSEQDTLHRMFNAVQPDSYVRPHRHLDPPKAEAWIVLRGAVMFFTFEEDGAIRDCIELRASGPAFGVDLVPGVFHTFLAIEPDTVVYEVKTGPYSARDDKTFARFAPAEGTLEASQYLEHLRQESARRLQH